SAAIAAPWSELTAAALAVASWLVLLVLHGTGKMWFWFAIGTAATLIYAATGWLWPHLAPGLIIPNMLMIGSPGTGKTMLARRLPTILPPLSPVESLSTTRIYSSLGQLPADEPLMATRPFRSPHHTISDAGMV